MKVEIFIDTICGWCFIGHRNLNSALKKFPKIKFKIKHIPFQLNPDMPAEGVLREKYLDIKFGGRNNAVPMYENMRIKAKESGIILNLDKIKKTPNTILSHLLIILSEQYNLENEIKEKIYQSYFVGGLDIGDKNILSNIAEETSIKKETFEKLITQENINKINEKVKFAKDKKVFGVPYFEIGKDFVSGAQNSIELEKIIKTNLN